MGTPFPPPSGSPTHSSPGESAINAMMLKLERGPTRPLPPTPVDTKSDLHNRAPLHPNKLGVPRITSDPSRQQRILPLWSLSETSDNYLTTPEPETSSISMSESPDSNQRWSPSEYPAKQSANPYEDLDNRVTHLEATLLRSTRSSGKLLSLVFQIQMEQHRLEEKMAQLQERINAGPSEKLSTDSGPLVGMLSMEQTSQPRALESDVDFMEATPHTVFSANSDESKDPPRLLGSPQARFRSLYEAYIREHEKDLGPRSIIVYTDDKSPPEVYKSFAEAYPHIKGRSGLSRFTYYGPEAPFISINYIGVTAGFGGDLSYDLPSYNAGLQRRYNHNYSYLAVRIRWTPEGSIQPDPKIIGIKTDPDHSRYIDVKMMVDTGAVVSLGPAGVLTQLGLTPGELNAVYGVMGTKHESRDVGVVLELQNADPREPNFSIPIQLNYVLQSGSLLTHTPEDASRQIQFSSQWILGRDFQQYFQMLWTNVVASKTTVDFIVSPQHQKADGTFLQTQRLIYPGRECVIESPVYRTPDGNFRVVLPEVPATVVPSVPTHPVPASRVSCCVIL